MTLFSPFIVIAAAGSRPARTAHRRFSRRNRTTIAAIGVDPTSNNSFVVEYALR